MTTEGFRCDFNLDWPVLEAQLTEHFKYCTREKRCIPLPLEVAPQPAFMLMKEIHCQMCSASCCRNPGTEKSDRAFISVSEGEKRAMVQAGAPRRAFKTLTRSGRVVTYLDYPCPLLDGNRCSVYEARPIACEKYPIQVNYPADGSLPGLALDSGCTQAAEVALRVYRNIHQARRARRI